ncbi:MULTISPECIES: serine hydrolase [Micromonospora]|uniref:Class A beta-lactamase-related serine hydrolase n=1 Tax=Micromonospora solifontis TaxID=2487138 RepID=A0ABX9WHU5_9ACTN|nr:MULTISPECIES: serine hydrolase domain-containing protein [Micromonospora]NES12470.1 beta-lactamase family protein [Micromonospora sp. PPF5-17B]NES36386.1 beta-lactamase family protein [Micromonospora solifontis]NES57768.1 beta-lactamase family protein [Micromonospora sp. PPF5-6]RNL99622.1 class A beta-lactamase-related serine hydrolase [Micromonospora solifontis]
MITVHDRLGRMVRQAQAEGRIPAVSVALHRADRPLWTCAVGGTGNDTPLDVETVFRIGSVTKTFTSVLVMQCRDDGLLDLDDPIGRHLDLPAHGELTVRRLLSHTAGLQREPHGDVWDTLRAPDVTGLLADLARVERVLPTGRRFHYSNLGLALLGELAARLRGGTWAEVLADRVLAPLGLTATGPTPGERAATGFLVDAYSDEARPEPPADFGAVAPAAQLWSTATDMARWAAFLADPAALDPAGAVLAPGTLDEMRWPLTTTDETLWAAGFGLGLILVPQPGRVVHVGHDGAMPGFLAAVYGRRGGDGTAGAMGCAVLGSSGTGTEVFELTHRLLAAAAEHDPAEIEPWRPGPPAPEHLRGVLGRWWGEGFEYVFSWHDGALRARGADDPAGKPPAVFAPLPDRPDVFRTVSGREAGELLRLTRDERGAVVRMHWATYRFSRHQETFDRYDFRTGS